MSDFDADTENFESWLKEHYTYISPKFTISDLRSLHQGRGLIANQEIEKDEILFELSRDSILNVSTSKLTTLKESNKEILYSLNQWESLILCLSYELMIGEDSKWFKYFKVLPYEFNSLMFWSDEELSNLKPSNVLHRIGKAEAESMYHKLCPRYCEELAVPQLTKFLTLEKFHIVASLIMSYSFDVDHPEEVEEEYGNEEGREEQEQEEVQEEEEEEEEEHEHGHEHDHDKKEDEEEEIERDSIERDLYFKSMVPLADTLNANTTLFNATLNYENQKLVMISTKEISKNEQIFNIYGELPNSEILRKYGYLELPCSNFEFTELNIEIIKEFYKEQKLDKSFVDPELLINRIIEIIDNSEYLDETLEDSEGGIVLPTYEVFNNGEVLMELTLLNLILSTLYESFKIDSKWFRKLYKSIKDDSGASGFENFVHRCILKSYQLLESNMLTRTSSSNLKNLISLKLNQYPEWITGENGFEIPENYDNFTRSQLSNIILKNEVNCLIKFLSVSNHTGKEEGFKFKIIDDEKLLNNVLKRKLESDSKKRNKKQKIRL